MEIKICIKCNIEKTNTFEYFTKTNKGLTSKMCKECKRKYDKQYREKNREKIRARDRESIKNRTEEQKNKKREYLKKYRIENPDKKENKEIVRERNKKRWADINIREVEKERINKWRKENSERIKEYRQTNKDRDREKRKEWRNTERGNELSKANVQRRRNKIKQLENSFTKKEWEFCIKYFDNRCAYCGLEKKLEHEHFITVSKNGEYTANNILPSCRQCNVLKHDKDFFEWYLTYKHYSYERMVKIAEYFKFINNKKHSNISRYEGN